MRHQISLLLLFIFLYLNFEGTDGQCDVPTLTEPLQWVGGTAATSPISDGGNADVNIECAAGYTLSGTATLSCTGTTLSNMPTCDGNACSDPGAAPENGQKDGYTFTHGSTVTYTCNDGYTLSGTGVLTCTAGEWDNEVPTCTEETAAGSSVAPTTKADSDSSPGENGAGVATFSYLMIPALILALLSN